MNNIGDIGDEVFRDRKKDQWKTLRHITTKANIMIGLAAVLGARNLGTPETGLELALFWLSYVSLGACMIWGLIAIFPRTYWEGPRMQRVEEILSSHGEEHARAWVSKAYTMTCDHNAKCLNASGLALYWGIVTLSCAVVIQTAYYIINIVNYLA